MKVSEDKLNRPKKFILTLYEIMNDQTISEIISWTESGRSFAIFNLTELSSKVLPKHFKHKNAASFIRQLNMYGFHKMRDTGEVLVYSHPDFVQGCPEKLLNLNRKSALLITKNRDADDKKLKTIKSKQKRLQLKIFSLEKGMKEVTEYNKLLVDQISQCLERQRKMEQIIGGFVNQVKEFPSSIDNVYYGIMGNNMMSQVDPIYYQNLFKYDSN